MDTAKIIKDKEGLIEALERKMEGTRVISEKYNIPPGIEGWLMAELINALQNTEIECSEDLEDYADEANLKTIPFDPNPSDSKVEFEDIYVKDEESGEDVLFFREYRIGLKDVQVLLGVSESTALRLAFRDPSMKWRSWEENNTEKVEGYGFKLTLLAYHRHLRRRFRHAF